MCMRLESPATHESNQQCFKREPDSEAWSTHTGKGQTSRQLLLHPRNFSCHFFPLDVPRNVTQKAIPRSRSTQWMSCHSLFLSVAFVVLSSSLPCLLPGTVNYRYSHWLCSEKLLQTLN